MTDIRQSSQWGQFLSRIGWNIEKVGNTQIFIRKVPLLNRSLIKIQHPQNPLPFQKIDQIAAQYHAFFTLIEPEEIGFDKTEFKKNGYKESSMSLTHTATVVIDIDKPEKEIFSSFSENARRNIKKAQKNQLEIKIVFLKECTDDQHFSQFYALLHNLSKLKKFYVPGYSEFHKKMLSFKNNSLLLFTYYNHQPVAVVWLAYYQKTLFYLHTGITNEGYKLLANYLLVWEAVKIAQEMKLKTFNFEGIYDPRFPKERQKWANFSEFKKRFHGTTIQYPQPQIKFYSKIFKLFYLCNQVLSR